VAVVANRIHSGAPFLFWACQDIEPPHSSVRFLLIGDELYRGELRGLARELGLEKEVLFL
jgi:hypothetical protein